AKLSAIGFAERDTIALNEETQLLPTIERLCELGLADYWTRSAAKFKEPFSTDGPKLDQRSYETNQNIEVSVIGCVEDTHARAAVSSCSTVNVFCPVSAKRLLG